MSVDFWIMLCFFLSILLKVILLFRVNKKELSMFYWKFSSLPIPIFSLKSINIIIINILVFLQLCFIIFLIYLQRNNIVFLINTFY